MSDDGAEQIRVILVEDDPEFAELYRTVLTMDGYAVDVADNGRTGLAMIREQIPDLVFLDVRMPEMSGLEVLRELRSEVSTAELPAVVLSNYDEPTMMEEARRLGALQWMVKVDTTPRMLADRTRAWLRMDRGDVSDH